MSIKNNISIIIRLSNGDEVNAFQNFYSKVFDIYHNGEFINLPISWLNEDETCFIDPHLKIKYYVV